jgi:hypothetical protein
MNERNDMTCGELADVAAELALGVLTGRERAMAVAHLEECEACRENVRQLMATGDQLLELLPPAEPPAGFESRVLERLGLSAPATEEERGVELPPAEPSAGFESRVLERLGLAAPSVRPQNAGQAGKEASGPDAYSQLVARPGGTGHRGAAREGKRLTGDRPGSDQPSAPPARPGGRKRPGRMRRVLAASAMGLAVIAAGLGGWRIGAGTSPAASTASGPLTQASLVTAAHQDVGDIFIYKGATRWVYMSVDMGSGNEAVTCQVIGADGRATTIGTFQLADGYGSWGSPAPGNLETATGARLVSANGTVLASATFR